MTEERDCDAAADAAHAEYIQDKTLEEYKACIKELRGLLSVMAAVTEDGKPFTLANVVRTHMLKAIEQANNLIGA